MTYANLLNVSCVDKVEAFCRIRDFLCKRNGTYDYSLTGIGWTLHDSSYAVDEDNPAVNDWYVIYSGGESTKDDLYFKVTWISGYLKIEGYQSWDNSTHTGSSNKYNIANNETMADSGALTIWVYGDLDSAIIINKLSTSDYRMCLFGKRQPGYSDMTGTIATCSSSLTAGSDVSIAVDSVPTNWAVGKEIFIRTTHNNAVATVKIEKITIKTLVGNTITTDLTNSYTANSRLSDWVGYGCQATFSFMSTFEEFINSAGNFRVQMSQGYNTGISTGAVDPDDYEDRIGLYTLFYTGSNGLPGYYPNIKVTPAHNATFDAEDVLVEEDGTEWRCFHAYSSKYVALKEV
ncbi:hypothetical protein [uncultured Desulfobacter sp.]|uniref:hypothetical protein n=1 Tax=uncultured Desulfobacter sp. TaxID=240139 RepID=UPI0029C70C9A|nr:hypothetical protein [uncultured Desulfobacter sp.]